MEKYQNMEYSFEERAADLVAHMTLEEKISQVGNLGAAIPRLGIPFYNYWSEASHGFFGPFKYRPMDVTSFPVCLAMSQSWDREKIKKVTEAISDECRAYHNIDGDELHMWCPTINMARDPRNGRSDENFGEDPFLTGKLSASYIQGMQGNDEKYIKTVATPKHYALNSSENNRHRGSSNVDEATMREYYTKAFEYAIKEGKAESIMTSYNRINGVPASCNEMLLTTLLREEWGFDGFVVSDCGAVGDVYGGDSMNAEGQKTVGHCYAKNLKEASAMTLLAGTDMSCGAEHKHNLLDAMEEGLITEGILDRALIRIFTSRFRLGLFDEKKSVPYSVIGKEAICSKDHAALSVDMANDTIVLLKNDKNILPLSKEGRKKILVVGPNAIYRELGGYSAGSISKVVETPVNIMALDGIREAVHGTDTEIIYEKGWCSGREFKESAMELLPGAELNTPDSGADPETMMAGIEDVLGPGVDFQSIGLAFMSPDKYKPEDTDYRKDNDLLFERALQKAKEADYVIVIAGTDGTTASEERDRETLELPYGQDEKIRKILAVNDNTVVVLTTLGAVKGKFFEKAHTVLNAHFAGEAQGTAIANVIFGDVNPNAKLTATWYQDEGELPHINDYGIRKNDTLDSKARTYMYYEGEPLFPFGHGLSYTTFTYENIRMNGSVLDANDTLEVQVDVTNTGERAGAEIVQLYIAKKSPEGTADNKPLRQLKGFEKIWLQPGETKTVTIQVPVSEITFWSYLYNKMIVEPGEYSVEIGRSSVDIPCSTTVEIAGEWNALLAAVYVSCDTPILQKNQSGQIKVSATLEDTTHLEASEYQITYESMDQEVLAVDDRGVVTAKSEGSTLVTITVSYKRECMSRQIPFAVR
ncbi:MAG: glycoside hydrolase family 3 C-terminal domain-containing protein [Lachnospiraceae bacterium]|nr:glycoside hydrolase family 3 C-terminal domain-containing protein [Lachnospiraceae bacterium]